MDIRIRKQTKNSPPTGVYSLLSLRVNNGGVWHFVWRKRLKQNGSLIASASYECPPKPSSPDAVCSLWSNNSFLFIWSLNVPGGAILCSLVARRNGRI